MKPDRKYDRFLLLRADGEWESLTVPRCFDVHDLAEHRAHSSIFLRVPRGCMVFSETGRIEGPIWAAWDRKRDTFTMGVDDPKSLGPRGVYAITS